MTHQAGQVQAQIDELTARLGELDQHLEHLQITRKTLLTLADESNAGQNRESSPAPELPEHPAYQQIMTAFADGGEPLRARDLCSNASSAAASSPSLNPVCSPSRARKPTPNPTSSEPHPTPTP
ncbi:hypothetical protein [Streptomyces stackebrandtii]|uniref:hypothetical protein n=1 Tax=Streptomyces stackebrandtii TaxID=3051177 RepID=UPI0028DC91D1|nr:hypothetical protein [Streptomyces sp. DSM 40976]